MKPAGRARRAVALAILALATAGSSARAAAPKVSAQLEPDPLGKDELATFTVVVEASSFGSPDIEPDFRLENLQIAGGPFRSTSQSWVNGVTSSSTQLVWRMRPQAVGTAAVRALRVKVDGDLVQLPDAAIQVVAQAPERQAAPQRNAPPDPFGSLFGEDPFGNLDQRRRRQPVSEPKIRMRATVEPQAGWVGQQLVWSLLLETQTDISRVEPRQMPDFRGFWVSDITPDQTPAPRWFEDHGDKFARVPVLERALFPLAPGSFVIPSVDVQVVAQVVDTDFFRPLGRSKAFDLTSGPVTVVARPLPPAPPGFGGVVGRLQLAAKVDRKEIETGQAASFTLTATSTGNLQSIEAPALSLPAGIRVFPPTRESEERVLGGHLETTVRWHYVLLADRPGRYDVAPVEIVYFDPEPTTYRSARSAGVSVAVRPGASSAAAAATNPPAAVAPEPKPPARPAGAGEGGGVRALETAAVAAVALAFGAALWRRRRKSGRPAETLRAALAASAGEPSPRAAAAQVEEAWRSFLAERWSIPRSLPAAQWGARLAEQGLSSDLGRELSTLFEELHFLAYAPELADVEAHRSEVVARSRQILRRLR